MIGIARYDHFTHLPKAAVDAEEIAALFERNDYTVFRLPQRFIAENQAAIAADKRLTATELSTELRIFLRDRAKNQEVVIYFAGHGFRVPNPLTENQVGYLATSDTTNDGQNAIPFDSLNSLLSDIELSSLVILLDCCYAGSLVEQRALLHPIQNTLSYKSVFLNK